MNGFSVSSRLTLSDWKAYQAAYLRRTQTRGWHGAALTLGVPILMGLLAYTVMRFAHTTVEGNWLFIGLLIGYGSLVVLSRIVRFWMKPLRDAAFLGEWTFEFTPVAIRIRRPQIDSTSSWGAVREITTTSEHLFIWIDAIAAYVVPVRDLPAGLSTEGAQSILHDLNVQVRSEADIEDGGTTVSSVPPYLMDRVPQLPRSLTRSMHAAVRWLSWRPFDGRAMDAPDFAIASLAFLSVALLIGLDRIGVGPKAEFSYFGAQVLACKTLGLLGIGWVIWRTTDPQVSWRTVLFVLAALTLLAVPVHWGIDHLSSGAAKVAAAFAILLVQTVYLARALRVVTGYRQLRSIAISLVGLLIGSGLISRYLNMAGQP